ncbi:MAG: UDP-N-acetylmuramoyl-tripeptide--D-alanyl-D-alanine ligase [Patescibacteria group bacterium]|nr:UDP-N-acetylmuramoyl-tripeptide--D-alanyl-D-alanine ligase [Patescibacteria group bacterium]
MKARLRRLTASLFEFQTRRLLKTHQFKIVAVSGAVGKTSTKIAIATMLRQKYRVLVQQGSFNDEIGLPLACFDLGLPGNILNPFSWLGVLFRMEQALHRPYPYDVLVIEVGTDAPGEVPHTLSYLRPHIGVVTAVVPEHMEYFKTLDAVAHEELALVAGSERAIVNYDDVAAKYRHKYVEPQPGHLYYGLDAKADYRIELSGTDPVNGTTGTLLKSGHARVTGANFALYGRHSAKAAAAAYAVADLLGLTKAEIEQGLASLKPVHGRMNPLPGRNGSTIVDDTYNSSPEALAAALDALAKAPITGRRIAILGSMNELGADAPRYHQEAGTAAAGLDLLITVGDLANKYLGPAAVAAGLDPTRSRPADSPYAAGDYLNLILQPGDIVLAKGSQNRVFVEEALKSLLADPADASQLVRQSPAWMRLKAKQFPDFPK